MIERRISERRFQSRKTQEECSSKQKVDNQIAENANDSNDCHCYKTARSKKIEWSKATETCRNTPKSEKSLQSILQVTPSIPLEYAACQPNSGNMQSMCTSDVQETESNG